MFRILPIVALSGASLAGCCCGTEVVPVDVRGEDSEVVLPEAEVVMDLGSRTPVGPNRRENTLSVGYSRGTGRFDQDLEDDEFISIKNDYLDGPAIVDHEVQLRVAHLRFVRHMFATNRFEWYWGAGLGYSTVKLRSTDGTETIRVEDDATGVHGLMGLSFLFHPAFGVEGNLGGFVLSSDDPLMLTDMRVQAIYAPFDSMGLMVGYRRWLGPYQPRSSLSDVEFDFSGPAVGIVVEY